MKDSRKKKNPLHRQKYESKIEESEGAHVDRYQGKAVITGFHNVQHLNQKSYNY